MSDLTYASVCSGIEAATVAWHPLGWRAAWYAEIDPFPCAVLAHHYPDTPNLGDFTKIGNEHGSIDLVVGGTPCQDFSVAGKRAGFDGLRGSLTFAYVDLVRRIRPRWIVWENVPGILGGDIRRGFAEFLRRLSDCGYSCCWRVLDAQYVRVDGLERAVPQRRRRVFVVGSLGDWRRAAAVLLEPESLRGHTPPRREAGERVAISPTLRAQGNSSHRADSQAFVPAVSPAMKARDSKGPSSDGDGDGLPLVAIQERAVSTNTSNGPGGKGWRDDGAAYTLEARQTSQAVAFAQNQLGEVRAGYVTNTLNTNANASGRSTAMAMIGPHVRRMTPRECERLQGFPDDYTLVPHRGKPAADCPRYKALGNSMAVNCMRWIGARINAVEELTHA